MSIEDGAVLAAARQTAEAAVEDLRLAADQMPPGSSDRLVPVPGSVGGCYMAADAVIGQIEVAMAARRSRTRR